MSGITHWKYLAVEYMPLEWAYPRMGKLFAFKTLDAACNCMETVSEEFLKNMQLWECEVKNPKGCGKILNLSEIMRTKILTIQKICNQPDEFQRFWYKALKCGSPLIYPWHDTILCDAVRLIRRIS